MKNVFNTNDSQELKQRINQLNSKSQAQWGKMNVGQMLAHCNVVYEMTYEPTQFEKPKGIKKLFLKHILKPIVVGNMSYKKNSKTAPGFLIKEEKDFDIEKQRILNFIDKTQELGALHFEGKENLSFGNLNSQQWNNLFYKHLNHHLNQFKV